MLSSYLEKNAFRPPLIQAKPNQDLGMVIVIPAYDEDSILLPLKALAECEHPKLSLEVIVVFNASEIEEEVVIQKNLQAKAEAEQFYNKLTHPLFKLHLLVEHELPKKHAGVGLARKIGMDEAVRRLHSVGKANAPIVCFDADSSCEPNYLQAIAKHFEENAQSSACSIHFEHPIIGSDFDSRIYRGITYYELHLRYYKNGLAYAGLPYAFHTIGSSMAVRAVDYCKQGGMNKRKAGEDFYFLQKFIKLGNFSEIKSTKVIPSPRISERVPFGTGRAMKEMVDRERDIDYSYAWDNFLVLKKTFQHVSTWYESPAEPHPYLEAFVGKEQFKEKIKEIRSQSTTKELFVKRFFHWFDAFQCLKFMHFLRDYYFPNQQLRESVPLLLKEIGGEPIDNSVVDLLRQLRRIDLS